MNCTQCGSDIKEGAKFCPQCGTQLAEPKTGARQPKGQPSKGRWITYGLMGAVLIVGLITFLQFIFREYHPVIEKQPIVDAPDYYGEQKVPSVAIQARIDKGYIVVPLEEVREKKLVRFFDPEGIQIIPILAYITPSGKVVTAMSKSENCGSTDFYLQGKNIHCASCPSYWDMTSMKAYACCQMYFPDPIPSRLVSDEIWIDVNSIRRWGTRL